MHEEESPQPKKPSQAVVEAALDMLKGRQQVETTVPVRGNSMLPLFRPGDLLSLTPTSTGAVSNIGRGDVIVFRRAGKLTVHRVILIKDGPTYITKGDNLSYFDAPVPAAQVLGRVVSLKRGAETIITDNRWWWLFGWLIVGYTLMWYYVYGFARRIKQRFLGSKPNRVTAFLRESALGGFALLRRVAQRVFGRSGKK